MSGPGRQVRWALGPALLYGLTLASCAAPPVTRYTLGQSAMVGAGVPLERQVIVIQIARVSLPDYLDTQDILVRRGSALESSHTGRWASRLSLGATDLLTASLGQARPDALVTDEPQIGARSYTILINISRLDVAAEIGATQGLATLEADWMILSPYPAVADARHRVRLEAGGPIGSDQDVVALERKILDQLAAAIDLTALR